MRILAIAASGAALAVLAACGGSEGSSTDTTSSPTSAATGSASPSASATKPSEEGPTINVDGVTVSGPKNEAPTITVTPGATAPTALVSQDVYTGEGTEITAGGAGSFQYSGVLFSDGTPFDSSWDRGRPIDISLDQVIPGWQQGIVGMKEGGRRLLIVPPDLAYGSAALQGIPPNSTLVFVVDLDTVFN